RCGRCSTDSLGRAASGCSAWMPTPSRMPAASAARSPRRVRSTTTSCRSLHASRSTRRRSDGSSRRCSSRSSTVWARPARTRAPQWLDVALLLVAQGTPVPVLLVLAMRELLGAPFPRDGALLLATSAALLAVRILLQLALAASYVTRGPTFWLAPTADPLAAI